MAKNYGGDAPLSYNKFPVSKKKALLSVIYT